MPNHCSLTEILASEVRCCDPCALDPRAQPDACCEHRTDLIAEKSTHGKIKSAVERHVSRTTFVICDALNFNKGFRYELFCVARAMATPSCVVRLSQRNAVRL